MKAPTKLMAFTLLKATMTQQLYVGSTLAGGTWGFNSSTVQEVLSLIPCSYPILSSKLPCPWGNLSFMLQIRYYSLNAQNSCFCWMPAMHWLVGTGFTAMPCAWLCWMSHCCRVETPVLRNNSWQQRDSSKPHLAVSVLRRNRMARKRSWMCQGEPFGSTSQIGQILSYTVILSLEGVSQQNKSPITHLANCVSCLGC